MTFKFNPLPKLEVMDNALPKATILFDRIDMKGILQGAVETVYQWHFDRTAETPPSLTCHMTPSITVLAKTMDGAPSRNRGMHFEQDGLVIYFSDKYLATFQDTNGDEAKQIFIEYIYEAVWWCLHPKFSDDSYPRKFCRGFSDYVLKLNKEITLPHGIQRTNKFGSWYDHETMPQFLEWMENKCGQGTVFKLNAALATPYDKTVFQAVTGESIQNLWKMYRSESLGKHQIDGDLEVVYADLESVLWPMPQISFTLDGKPDGNANTHLRDAITRAVLITFKHMYTPGTVPTTVKEFNIDRKSVGTWELSESGSGYKFKMSLEQIEEFERTLGHTADHKDDPQTDHKDDGPSNRTKDDKTFANDFFDLLALCVADCYCTCSTTASKRNDKDPSSHPWIMGMVAFLSIKEGLAPLFKDRPDEVKKTRSQEEQDISLTGDFLFWIESTVGDGTVKKLNKLMSQDRCRASWFPTLTDGKSLDELLKDYKTAVPDAQLPKKMDSLATP